jgi:hypothetical protein
VLIFLKKHFPFVLCLFDAMQSEKVAEKSKKKQIGAATAVRHHTCAFIEQTFIPAYGFLVGKQQSTAPYISSNAPYVEISCVSPNVSLQRSQVTGVTMYPFCQAGV